MISSVEPGATEALDDTHPFVAYASFCKALMGHGTRHLDA
jgi:hypothetical protein